jgi:hypothetical protein
MSTTDNPISPSDATLCRVVARLFRATARAMEDLIKDPSSRERGDVARVVSQELKARLASMPAHLIERLPGIREKLARDIEPAIEMLGTMEQAVEAGR